MGERPPVKSRGSEDSKGLSFLGSPSPIIEISPFFPLRFYNERFLCSYEMMMYPFDIQVTLSYILTFFILRHFLDPLIFRLPEEIPIS